MGSENLNENVDALTSLRARAELKVSRHQRRIEHVVDQLGRPRTLYFIVAAVAAWVCVNLLAVRFGVRPIDPPPFAWLQGTLGLVSVVMTTTVLTTQSRQNRLAEQRAELELKVNLLAEQKIAKIIALLEELRRDLPTVPNRVDPLAELMTEPVDPHVVLSALELASDLKGELAADTASPLPEGGERSPGTEE